VHYGRHLPQGTAGCFFLFLTDPATFETFVAEVKLGDAAKPVFSELLPILFF
jgi:hypothetical protein